MLNLSFPKYFVFCYFVLKAVEGLHHNHRHSVNTYLPKSAIPSPSDSHDEDYKGYSSKKDHVSYEFSYNVRDDDSGLLFGHKESREGKKTEGEYRVKLPDGRTQIVSYVADEGGYRAKVSYITHVEKYTADKNKEHYHREEKTSKELIYARNKTENERLTESLEDQRLRENLNKLATVVDQEIRNEAQQHQNEKHRTRGDPSQSEAKKMFTEPQKSKPFNLIRKNPYFPPVAPNSFFDSDGISNLLNPTFLIGINEDGPQEISSYLTYEANNPEEN